MRERECARKKKGERNRVDSYPATSDVMVFFLSFLYIFFFICIFFFFSPSFLLIFILVCGGGLVMIAYCLKSFSLPADLKKKKLCCFTQQAKKMEIKKKIITNQWKTAGRCTARCVCVCA